MQNGSKEIANPCQWEETFLWPLFFCTTSNAIVVSSVQRDSLYKTIRGSWFNHNHTLIIDSNAWIKVCQQGMLLPAFLLSLILSLTWICLKLVLFLGKNLKKEGNLCWIWMPGTWQERPLGRDGLPKLRCTVTNNIEGTFLQNTTFYEKLTFWCYNHVTNCLASCDKRF